MDIKTTPTKVVLNCFGLLVGLWQLFVHLNLILSNHVWFVQHRQFQRFQLYGPMIITPCQAVREIRANLTLLQKKIQRKWIVANYVQILKIKGPLSRLRSCDKLKKISAGADGGPRFRVCARETLRSAPHQHQRIFGAHVCRVTFKHLPQPL